MNSAESDFLIELKKLFVKYNVNFNYDDCEELGSGEFSGNQLKIKTVDSITSNYLIDLYVEDIDFE